MNAINDAKFPVAGFTYDPVTGFIFKDGRRRDYNDSPYRRVSRKRVRVMAQRLAWRLHYGVWPPTDIEIDHENCNVQDNRIGRTAPTVPRINSVAAENVVCIGLQAGRNGWWPSTASTSRLGVTLPIKSAPSSPPD